MLPASAATPPPAYGKLDKMDAAEARHIKAQFLIHKVLEEATSSSSTARSRRPPTALVRVKARIGVRLKKLRLAIRGIRVCARRAVQRHLRNLRRLIAHGGGRGSSSVKPAGPPS
ncbi:uncharacterized protein [Miscanthus floridulus]|uniref:uncharacterized protein n=1 Tax=Miscanthus floridulus TaxID=154761 RepID=UPI0034583BEB